MIFNSDINSLALEDINRMLKKVNQIATNPLSCKDEKILKMKEMKEKGEEYNSNQRNETELIEDTITQIGILLALNFGELGSEIIAKNMAQQGELNLSLPGKKMFGIFGYCNIKNFQDITEIL